MVNGNGSRPPRPGRSCQAVLAAAVVLGVGLAFLAVAPTVSAEPSNCVQLGSFHAYSCAFHEPGTGGGVYELNVLFENWYYWHPLPGDLVVDETYVKAGAPGYSFPYHRSIHFADTRSVVDETWLEGFPHNTEPPSACDGAGVVMPCTANEQKSAMDFQHAMVADQIPNSF